MNPTSVQFRVCLLEPIPEIFIAAKYLDEAVSAHLGGKHAAADELIRLADMQVINDWSEALWGKGGPHSRPLPVKNPIPFVPRMARVVQRQAGVAIKRDLIIRDGFKCRFCGIPLVRGVTRSLIRKCYPNALRWGLANADKHAAFQAMDLHYDHLLPHARGGSNEMDNMLVTCAPCNCGRDNLTLEEVRVSDPRDRDVSRTSWDGLERFRC
jgi:5-methylcytosine-specific restriction endonuclease McrA